MQNSFRRILIGTAFFVLTVIIAVVGYIFFGWTILDSIYMVVITIFGVGYGEVKPLETAPEKNFYDLSDSCGYFFSIIYRGRICTDDCRRGN